VKVPFLGVLHFECKFRDLNLDLSAGMLICARAIEQRVRSNTSIIHSGTPEEPVGPFGTCGEEFLFWESPRDHLFWFLRSCTWYAKSLRPNLPLAPRMAGWPSLLQMSCRAPPERRIALHSSKPNSTAMCRGVFPLRFCAFTSHQARGA